MSLKILVEDQIHLLFTENPELQTIKKNEFEVAVASFANLNYLNGLEFDDLIDGIMGDGGDEGIDLCYIFCNGTLVKDENHPINKESIVKVKFFQVKKEDSFSTDGFRKLKEGVEEIFNLELDLDKFQSLGANTEILEQAALIRAVFRKTMRQRAKFSCEVYYATIAPDLNISNKIKHLEEVLKNNSLGIDYNFEYWGAQQILNIIKKSDEQVEIKFESQPLQVFVKDTVTTGFAGFVKGNDLIKSLLDSDGKFRSHLTEGNIRYFLGEDKKINSSIIDSALDDSKSSIFWAMNNGLTIIGDSIVPLDNKGYNITNPQIVNGCQTVHCLYHAFQQNNRNNLSDSLHVFVKLVKTENLDIQTDIISATNSQNPVKAASLKANDNIQRNIETHLLPSNIFYERRDNFYKRLGYSGNKVIGLLKMAQIIHTVVNKESIVAVNDTTTLFDSDSKYNTLFSERADFDIYKFSVILYQKIWTIKNSDLRNNEYGNDQRELISKGGFVLLHIMSTLLFSMSNINKGKAGFKFINGPFSLSLPNRKNEFSIRKDWLFSTLNLDEVIEDYYSASKTLFIMAAEEYSNKTGRPRTTLFKNRSFDKDYVIPMIESRMNNIVALFQGKI